VPTDNRRRPQRSIRRAPIEPARVEFRRGAARCAGALLRTLAFARALCCSLAFAALLAYASDGPAGAPSATSAADAGIARLKDAIAARLLLADDVARYKWNHGLPVLDAEREAAVLERTTNAAAALGIPQDYARRVIGGQIAASRDRQQASIDVWRRQQHGRFADVPDLSHVQRPALERATTELLTQLRASMCSLDAAARTTLTAPPPALADSPDAWSAAVDPLWPPPETCRG